MIKNHAVYVYMILMFYLLDYYSFSDVQMIEFRSLPVAFNCLTGSVSGVKASGKHISSKVVVIVLLLCVILTTIAFLMLVLCYVYRKGKFHLRSSVISSDKESCNSATNLISHRITSVPETRVEVVSPIDLATGKWANTNGYNLYP